MIAFIIAIALANVIAGRVEDVFGANLPYKRLWVALFRCIIPGVLALDHGWYAGLSVAVGSVLWFAYGWSFAEITGVEDDTKYPHWLQWLAKKIVPNDNKVKLRAIIAKGIRGSFDILTFAMLTAINPYAIFLWLGTFSMGLVYYICGKFFGSRSVAVAELTYGAVRGLLINLAL